MKRSIVVAFGYFTACLSGLVLVPLPVAIAGDDIVTEFNGQNLAGWQTEGNWVVEPEGVIALRPRPGEGGWQRFASYLWAEQQYAGFMFNLEYRM